MSQVFKIVLTIRGKEPGVGRFWIVEAEQPDLQAFCAAVTRQPIIVRQLFTRPMPDGRMEIINSREVMISVDLILYAEVPTYQYVRFVDDGPEPVAIPFRQPRAVDDEEALRA